MDTSRQGGERASDTRCWWFPVKSWFLHVGLALFSYGCTIDLEPVRCLSDDDCANLDELCVAGLCRHTDDPRIRIFSPPPGALNSTSAVVAVQTANFVIDAASFGGEPVAGRGHWHYFLNGTYLDASTKTEARLTRLPVGVNRIRVQLAENDHTPIEGAEDEIVLEVTSESRALLITRPERVAGGALQVEPDEVLTIEVQLSNFTLDPESIGGEPAACLCEGHIHVYVDETYQFATADTAFELDLAAAVGSDSEALEPGIHLLEVRLSENDHTELVPPVFDNVSIAIRAEL